MADLLATGATWLAGKLQTAVYQSITAARNGNAIGSSLRATYGRTVFEQDTVTGVIQWEARDFILDAADYTYEGSVVKPANGDRITDHLGHVYEALGNGAEPCFRYTDPTHVQIRIHTKQVG